MCGIFGYLGKDKADVICLEGLKKLEYRGYDSSGIAGIQDRGITLHKALGPVEALGKIITPLNLHLSAAIAHTRWATHGKPSLENAHPHLDEHKTLAVVHNGIIENYSTLRKELIEDHRTLFSSETDTEVIAQYIASVYEGELLQAVRKTLPKLEGSFAVAIIHQNHPEQIIASAEQCPLLIAFCPETKETFLCSDKLGLPSQKLHLFYLVDREIALLSQGKDPLFFDKDGTPLTKKEEIYISSKNIGSKGSYEHFMLKEIFEQADIVKEILKNRLNLENYTVYFEELQENAKQLTNIDRVILIGCGTSYHAALLATYFFESLAHIPAEAKIASEYRYQDPIIPKNTLVIALSQSGETADTLAALRHIKDKAAATLALCNVEGSTLTRDADFTLFMHAGPEIAVASTKTFTAQIVLLYLMAIAYTKNKEMTQESRRNLLKTLYEIPEQIQEVLSEAPAIEKIANHYAKAEDLFFLGRGPLFPTALEAALKVKEIAYINAQGYPAGEMKHGPIALLGKKVPVAILCTSEKLQTKIMNNLMESKARGSPIIVFGWRQFEKEIAAKADAIIWIPKTSDYLSCILLTIATQIFAYFMAKDRKTHIDKPRNLAKSVTVE